MVILPLIALIVAWFMTRDMERVYDTNTTIYTGMITWFCWWKFSDQHHQLDVIDYN